MRIGIYNQNCTRAGRAVSDEVLEEHDLQEHGGEPCDGGCACDWTLYEGTGAELANQAKSTARYARQQTGGNRQFYQRVADTLRHVVSIER